MRIDQFTLAHWMNARKYTVAQTAELAGLPGERPGQVLGENGADLEPAQLAAVAAALRVDQAQLAASPARDVAVVHQSPEAMQATRRPIQRDGVHFYASLKSEGPSPIHLRIRPGSLAGLGRPRITPAEVARRFRAFVTAPVEA